MAVRAELSGPCSVAPSASQASSIIAIPLSSQSGSSAVVLGGVAEDVDRDDRLRARRDRGRDRIRVEVERLRVDVGEDRRRAFVDRAVRRGDERVRRRDHLVAGADAREPHAEMQAGGSGRDGGAVRRVDRVSEQRLEARAHRAEREPARAQHLEHELLVALVDPRCAEVDASVAVRQLRASCGTGSSQCDQRSLFPRTVSRYAFWIASVISPTPISWSSIERSGVTSAAVPVMNTSSAR